MEEVSRLEEDEYSDAAAEGEEQAVKVNAEIAALAKPLIQKIVDDIDGAAEQINQKDPAKYPPDQIKMVIKSTLSKILSAK